MAAVAVTHPAAAEDGASESPPKSRDAKATDAKGPAVDAKMEAIRNDLRLPVKPREEGEQKPAEGASPSTSGQVPQETPRVQAPEGILEAEPDLAAREDAASRRRFGQALGAGGVVAAVAGTYLVVATLVARPNTFGEFATGRSEFLVAGLAGIGVGAGLMIGGFSLAAANRPPTVGMDRVPAVVEQRAFGEMGVSLSGKF